MADKTWKAVERRIAQRLSGRRVGCTGGATADVLTEYFSVEVKTRKRLPALLREGMAQAMANAASLTVPLLVLHELGRKHDDDLVIMRLEDFEEWYEERSAAIVSMQPPEGMG